MSNANSVGGAVMRCVRCRTNNLQLYFVVKTPGGNKVCCSTDCLFQFRSARPDQEEMEEGMEERGVCRPLHNEAPPPTPPGVDAASHGTTQSQAPPPPPTLNKKTMDKKQQEDKKGAFNKEFKWSEYLEATQSQSAPAHCFKQYEVPPANEFAIGMKLEAIDPRNITATCVATVIRTCGPWIRLRLDGSDSTNDFWRMNDSTEIQPLGTCERNEGFLQPPLTFSKDLSAWPMFVRKTLNGASKAPETCFKAEPPTPRANLFKIGDKLEAIYRKNGLLYVATVGDVDGDSIKVTFDGWGADFDFWCKYYSRDIFPVGWGEQAKYPLEPPRISKPRLVRSQVAQAARSSTSRGHRPHGIGKAKTGSGKRKLAPGKVKVRSTVATQREVEMNQREAVNVNEPRVEQQDPRAWTVERVISHIISVDGSLSVVADMFRHHEIDGWALLLLDYTDMMRYMKLKLGPALKICNIISMLKSKYMLN